MAKISDAPKALAPYLFHGLPLAWSNGAPHAVAECPWCGRDKKFSVSTVTGIWQCFVCHEGSKKGGGNAYTFLRMLWSLSRDRTRDEDYVALATDRKLLDPETLVRWGIVKSALDDSWLMPGYGPDGSLNNLYSYRQTLSRKQFFPTSGISHQLHGVNLFDKNKPQVWVAEGPWDGMALWEALRYAGKLNEISVLAVPNCGAAGEPLRKFLPLLSGKHVTLLFDSDRPRTQNNKTLPPAGFSATKRVVNICTSMEAPPATINWLDWGPEGYDTDLPDGYDVRDWLADGADSESRVDELEKMFERVKHVPSDWVSTTPNGDIQSATAAASTLETLPCNSWEDLVIAWRKAVEWRDGIGDVLAIMSAVAFSTLQKGDQLFLQVIGDPGSLKTTLCSGLLVSKYNYELDHLTGFHSGWKDASGNEYSLLSRINGKCIITPEADVLLSSPNFAQIMSQQRRIFDGKMRAVYKNRAEELDWSNLRTPWIMAGTPAVLESDQSKLGDRFLIIRMDRPDEEGEEAILRRSGYTALRAVVQTSNCSAKSQLPEDLALAYQLTGGYIDWLRQDPEGLLASVAVDEEDYITRVSKLAQFTADLRARPHQDPKKDVEVFKELPGRLQHQFIRLGMCLAVVRNTFRIDESIYRLLRRVAIDTTHQRNLDIVRAIYPEHYRNGVSLGKIASLIGLGEDKTRSILNFLQRIHVVQLRGIMHGMSRLDRYFLTDRTANLYKEILGA